MNWDEVGAIGQVLGSLAVFVTLGYLAIQVKHSRQDARRALSQGRGEANRDVLALQCDERINRIFERANIALGSPPFPFVSALIEQVGLTTEEATLLSWLEVTRWSYRIQIIPNADELSPMERAQFDGAIRASCGMPGVTRLFYEHVKPNAHPDALRYIDNLLTQPG
jgi:hypothetical protein